MPDLATLLGLSGWAAVLFIVAASSSVFLARVSVMRLLESERDRWMQDAAVVLEAEKARLARELGDHQATLRHGLDRDAAEHQLRFEAIHTRRAEFLIELHRRIHRVTQTYSALTSGYREVVTETCDGIDYPQEFERQERRHRQEARAAAQALVDFADDNMILLDRDLEAQVGEFRALIYDAWLTYSELPVTDNRVWPKEAQDLMRQARTTVAAAKCLEEPIKERFRKILGIPTSIRLPDNAEEAAK